MRCTRYVGIACCDGSCPIANAAEYVERGMDLVKDCSDCYKYRGCDDCAFSDTSDCLFSPMEESK